MYYTLSPGESISDLPAALVASVLSAVEAVSHEKSQKSLLNDGAPE